MHYLQIVIC